LIERLGSGGAAEAWRALRRGPLLSEEVCLKLPLEGRRSAVRRALLEEARLLSRLRHANVVSLIDVVEAESGILFLVLEWVRGLDLRTLQTAVEGAGQRLSPAAVASVGLGVCRALAAAQRSELGGVVHRDVTPHNLLVSVEGEVKLADFGIARALDRECWTAAGHVKGKTGYVSPEQVRGEDLDVRSDLFAVGVVLFELLAGCRPFLGSCRASTLRAITNAERPRLGAVAPTVPTVLASVVERLLAHDRDLRPSSADEAVRLLAPHARPSSAQELGRWARRRSPRA
jgi:serine/threonine protein kinase